MAQPGAVAAPATGQGQAQGQRQQQQSSPFMSMIRMVMFWYFISNWFFKKPPKDPGMVMKNLFNKGEELDMWVYLSEKPRFSSFRDESALVWYQSGIPYALYTPASFRTQHLEYTPSRAVKNNGTVFAHIYFARSGFSPDPTDPSFERTSTFNYIHPLVTYYKRPKNETRKHLIGSGTEGGEAGKGEEEKEEDKGEGSEEEKEEEGEDEPMFVLGGGKQGVVGGSATGEVAVQVQVQEQTEEWISYWKPNLTISLIDDFTAYSINKVPQIFIPYMHFDPNVGGYYPTIFPNEFWLLRDRLVPINATVSTLNLTLALETLSLWRWQIYLSMDQSFKLQHDYGATLEGEADELKRVFLEGNPVLLGITMVVSILHSVFDFLAFKNDIQFWNQNKSMEGLSARTVVLNFICQFIVFLYLLDNDTSWLILISAGISCAIEFWKIGKAMHVEVDRSGRFPVLRFSDRDSYKQNKTKEYDALAMKYLSYALYPLVISYALYSLLYDTHRSWYSWVLSSLTGCVYTFGFIMMCPQLFINYKLKSVAHLPWRQMTYKFLNTIVDDLFAFVIKMPTLHRLSVFRDDLVFMIFLYQFWIYPVDKNRVNEFGFGGAETEGQTAPKAIAGKSGEEGGGESSTGGTPSGAVPEAAAAGTETLIASTPDVSSSKNVSKQGLSKRGKKGEASG